MLFVQHISLTYCKNVRYADYANARNAIKFAPVKIEKVPDCEVLFNQIMLFQNTDELHKYSNTTRKCNSDDPSLYNPQCYNFLPFDNRISIKKSDRNYEIIYRDGKSKGYFKSPFTLKNNEYGRIIYNNRYVSSDTGKWYYELHTLNFINCDKSKYRKKMFFRKVPDYEYKNMQYLRYC
ncbi:MAG: hypothetical protein NC177_02245 [Ruminococcus flavefaciens]|nr:hypothetical protein [Ruminococcus flavefaciens]